MRKNWIISNLVMSSVFLFVSVLTGVAEASQPVVGRKAASRYFESNPSVAREPAEDIVRRGGGNGGSQLLMLAVGSFVSSKAYLVGPRSSEENVGRMSYGVTYLYDQWAGLDLNLRADFNEYRVDSHHTKKLSLMPLVTFPRAESRFPLYFGFGAGLGVFFQQLPSESSLSLDYQLVAGARFMDLFENFGFFFELGMKNHLHLLSDGQVNGTAVTAGAVFSF